MPKQAFDIIVDKINYKELGGKGLEIPDDEKDLKKKNN
jgi:hypothetical protein